MSSEYIAWYSLCVTCASHAVICTVGLDVSLLSHTVAAGNTLLLPPIMGFSDFDVQHAQPTAMGTSFDSVTCCRLAAVPVLQQCCVAHPAKVTCHR